VSLLNLRPCVTFRNKLFFFYREGMSTPRPTPNLVDHPMSVVRYWLFNIFAATLHIWGRLLHPKTIFLQHLPQHFTPTHSRTLFSAHIRSSFSALLYESHSFISLRFYTFNLDCKIMTTLSVYWKSVLNSCDFSSFLVFITSLYT
jgi:hypothetical protein